MRKSQWRKPYRVKKKKKPILRSRIFWRGILILILSGEIFYFLIFSSLFQVKEIKISGGEEIKISDLKNIISRQIDKRVLFFPTRSLFLLNSRKMEKDVLEVFPLIAEINIRRVFPATAEVAIKERKATAFFEFAGREFFLDKEGVVFKEKDMSEGEYLKISGIVLDQMPNLGDKIISGDLLESILKIESQLKESIKIFPKEVFLAAGDRLNVKINEGWEIYFDPQKDLDWQTAKLAALLESEIPQAKRKNLGYIDLRFGNLAPYKYR
ncbi:MAG: FtsQ-type POTRA domain-containing protein [bacterium]